MAPTLDVLVLFLFRQTTECMRSGHFFYRTTKRLERQADTHKLVQRNPFVYSIFNVRYKTGRTTGSPFDFFSALCDFFSIFLSPKGPPFKIFDILQQTEDSKSPKGLPFLLFRHYETVSEFSFSVFFEIISKNFSNVF